MLFQNSVIEALPPLLGASFCVEKFVGSRILFDRFQSRKSTRVCRITSGSAGVRDEHNKASDAPNSFDQSGLGKRKRQPKTNDHQNSQEATTDQEIDVRTAASVGLDESALGCGCKSVP